MPAHVNVSVIVTKGDLLVGVDMEKVFDDLTRGTIAEQSPRFLTADRNSPTEDDAVPAVERGLGVSQLLAHIATSPAPRPDVKWPVTPPPAPSKMLGRVWGAK